MLKWYKRGMPHANDATRIMNTWRMKTDPVWLKQIVEELKQKTV